jgi:hypothetical protein
MYVWLDVDVPQGAQTLASELLEMFGENGYAMLVDEGGKVDNPNQKGYSDTALQLATESSMDKSLLLLGSQRRVRLMS